MITEARLTIGDDELFYTSVCLKLKAGKSGCVCVLDLLCGERSTAVLSDINQSRKKAASAASDIIAPSHQIRKARRTTCLKCHLGIFDKNWCRKELHEGSLFPTLRSVGDNLQARYALGRGYPQAS